MTEFGRYRLSYEPPQGCVEAEVEMAISSEATLPQIIELFEAFLKASGYVFEGRLEVVTGEEVEELERERDFWKEQTCKLLEADEE